MALISLLAVIGFLVWNQNKKKEIKTVTPETKAIKQTLTLSGEVVADKDSKLKFLSAGRLTYLKVSTGDSVKKGELLASIDTTDLKTVEITAENTWLAADAAAKKAEDDVKNHAGDETFAQKVTRVTAQTARDAAYFKWQAAKQALRDAYLIAPFDGIVAIVNNLQVNTNVAADAYIEVVDPQTLYFSADLDETDLNKVTVGQKAEISLDAFEEESFDSQIMSIDFAPRPDVTGTVYGIHFSLPAEFLNKFRLGLNGEAEVVLQQKESAVVLPYNALLEIRGDSAKIKIIKNGSEEVVEVKLGILTDNEAEILTKLDPQTIVVIPSNGKK